MTEQSEKARADRYAFELKRVYDKLAEIASLTGHTLIPEAATVRPATATHVKPLEFLEIVRQTIKTPTTPTAAQIPPSIPR